MIDSEIEYWKRKTKEYEWLYKEQKDLCDGFKKLLDEYRERLDEKIRDE